MPNGLAVGCRPRRERHARDRLIETHVDLAYAVARRFAGRGEEMDYLRQVALLALVQAADRFDSSRGLAFSSFAMPTIVGSLKRHFRDRTWAIRPPRPLQERYLEVNAAIEILTGELRRVPTVGEIASYGKWSDQQVREALAERSHRYLEHWDAADPDGSREPGSIDDHFSRVEQRHVLDDLLGGLDARERAVVTMRYFEELGQSVIGTRIGASQIQVSRLVRTGLDNLRAGAAERSRNVPACSP